MRHFFFFIAFLISSLCNAQHLKFMGIPIDGTINTFQQKLAAKGVKYNKDSEYFGPGSRMYTGNFCGYSAKIFVYYNTRNSKVYRAKAVYTISDESTTKRRYKEIRDLLKDKYTYSLEDIDLSIDGGMASYYYPMSNGKEIGEINCYYVKDFVNYETVYQVFIDYWDKINSDENDSSKSDDL